MNKSKIPCDSFLTKKYNKILRQNTALQMECERLRMENEKFKKTTIRTFQTMFAVL